MPRSATAWRLALAVLVATFVSIGNRSANAQAEIVDLPVSSGGTERVLFIAAHSERHTKQILEVKSDPNFPAK